MWPKDLDILRHTGVRGPWDHPQQRPQLQRGLLVSGHPGVWAPYWQVRACVHLCFQSAVRPVIIHFITSISRCWFALIVCWREQRAAEKHPFQQASAKPKAQLNVCIFRSSAPQSSVLREWPDDDVHFHLERHWEDGLPQEDHQETRGPHTQAMQVQDHARRATFKNRAWKSYNLTSWIFPPDFSEQNMIIKISGIMKNVDQCFTNPEMMHSRNQEICLP